MTAKTDLENALSILDAGITSHVAALKSTRAASAVAQAAANDETYVKTITTKVLAWADALAASNPEPAAPVTPVASAVPVATPVLTPAAQVAAQVAAQPAPAPLVSQAAPIVPPAPAPMVAALVPAPVTPPAMPIAPAAVPGLVSSLETLMSHWGDHGAKK